MTSHAADIPQLAISRYYGGVTWAKNPTRALEHYCNGTANVIA